MFTARLGRKVTVRPVLFVFGSYVFVVHWLACTGHENGRKQCPSHSMIDRSNALHSKMKTKPYLAIRFSTWRIGSVFPTSNYKC